MKNKDGIREMFYQYYQNKKQKYNKTFPQGLIEKKGFLHKKKTVLYRPVAAFVFSVLLIIFSVGFIVKVISKKDNQSPLALVCTRLYEKYDWQKSIDEGLNELNSLLRVEAKKGDLF